MKQFILSAILITVFAGFNSAQNNLRRTDVAPGNFAVGFKTILKFDRTRMVKDATDINGNLFDGNRSRPIEITVWYPAEKGGTAMKYEDYLFARLNFRNQNKPPTEEQKQIVVRNFLETRIRNGADAKLLEQFLKADLSVFYDAPAAEGKFPIVIMPSGAYQFDNAELGELLASHGYIAVHTPGYRPTLEYVDDLAFAVNYLAENSNADTNKMGAIGFSYGGLVATMFHLKNRSLSAIVSLDGVEVWKWGVDEILASPNYSVRRADVPYLRFHNAKQNEQATTPTSKVDWRFYEAVRYADVMQFDFDKVTHIDFLSSSLTRANIPNFVPNSPKPDPSISEVQKIIQTYTLKFLDANVKKDERAKVFLSKTPDQKIAAFNLKKGAKPLPSSSQIADAILQNDGALTVKKVLTDLKTKGESLTNIFDENQMNAWGYQLLNQNRFAEAIAIFEVNVEAFPNSSNVYDSLAEGFERNGQLKQAAEFYEKAYKTAEKNGEAEFAKTTKANFERVTTKLK